MADTERIFIAVNLDDIVQKKLKKAQDLLRDCSLSIKWVEKENFHITLKFLGDITNSQLIEVKDRLKKIALNISSFDIIIKGLGAFPNLEQPKIIWSGVKKNKKKLISLHQAIEEQMLDLGFGAEKHDYTPHITLGRVRKREDNYDLVSDKIKDFSFEINAHQIVDRIAVVKSELTPQGPIYSTVAEFEL
ncbi:MAG: RNA 2',3'-cyclic phosphodiesterase [Halanaerobacter sp.]